MRQAKYEPLLLRVTMAVVVMNLIDAAVTLLLVEGGLATEANPLMASAILQGGPVGFMVAKLLLVSLGMAMLWGRRERRMAVFGIACAAAVYVGVCAYHLKSLSVLARSVV